MDELKNNEQNYIYWIDRLSDENKQLQVKISKSVTKDISQPNQINIIQDWNEAIRVFAKSFLYKKTPTSFYRIMATYLGKIIGIDIRMSNHPAGKDENWGITEGNGLANARLSIYFRGDTSALTKNCNDGVPLFEQGFHYKHLKDTKVLTDIRNAIIGFIKNGCYCGVNQPFIESDENVAERFRKEEIERNERKRERYHDGRATKGSNDTANNNDINDDSTSSLYESKNYKNMKKNVQRINESQLRAIVAESVKKVLNEMNPDLEPLRKMSRSYHPNMDCQQNILNKTFNSGNGSIPFVEIMPDEKVLLVNKSFANKNDMQRIQQCFPEYSIEEVSLDYPDYYFHNNIRSKR